MTQKSTLVKVAAKGSWQGGVKTSNEIRHFDPVIMDEPAALGGTDLGPNPMEYVVAALNGCKGVMIPLVAQEQNFQFTNIEFETTGIIDTKGLMGETDVSPHFQKIRFTVHLTTNESDEKIEKLKKEVERRCPVYNLFVSANIPVDIKWVKVN